MNDKNYTTVAGVIQFPPKDREVNGKAVREVQIRAIGSGKDVRVTVWDDYAHVPLAKGDVIFADGSATQNTGQSTDGSTVTYNNLSCLLLIRIPGAPKAETNRVVNTPQLDDVDSLF